MRMIDFELEDSSDWKFSVYGFLALGARSQSVSISEDLVSWGFVFLFWLFEFLLRHFTIILVFLDFSNCGFSICTLFTLCPFETKNGSICNIWTEIAFLIGQVFFVLEWPNGEFVSFSLATLCWQNHYVCKVALFHRDVVLF
jgi:hypothetical protein